MTDEIKPQRDDKGRFLPGNEVGKIPREKLWDITELEQAIREVEAEGDEKTGAKLDLLKHFVKRAFVSDRILAEIISKKIPKISISELKGSGNAWNVFITEFSDSGLPEDLKKKVEEFRKSQLIKEQGEGENQS